MHKPRDLDKLTQWSDGGAVAVLVIAALWSLPILTLLLTRWGLSRYVAPCITGVLVLLALLINVRAQRRAQAMQKPITPDVVEAAQQRFLPRGHEARYTVDGGRSPGGDAIQKAEAPGPCGGNESL